MVRVEQIKRLLRIVVAHCERIVVAAAAAAPRLAGRPDQASRFLEANLLSSHSTTEESAHARMALSFSILRRHQRGGFGDMLSLLLQCTLRGHVIDHLFERRNRPA